MNRTSLLLATVLGLGTPFAAHAACTMSRPVVSFNSYDVANPLPVTAAPVLTISCGNGDRTVYVDIGPSLISGSIANRQMKHVTLADRLDYNLYQDAGYSIVWGDASGGRMTLTRPRDTTLTIYARIPAQQDVNVGNYSDSVTISITP